ncbi:MAG TPA: nuclear transport factor 2 family protein [Terriglobales bacterium]|nr:nuclear transport factor 2 family protein [Terriglobales bacterium]
MKKFALGCFLLLCVMAVAQSRSDTESKLIAMENAWNAAQREHDTKTLEVLLADTFINTEWDGSVENKAQFLKSIKDPSMKFASFTTDDVSVFMYGNTGVVAGAYHVKGTRSGKPYEAHGRFTDTWVQIKGKWQCVASAAVHTK